MLSQEIIDDLEKFTKKIMQNEGISDYELKIEGQTEIGMNYGSDIIFFNVTSEESGKKYDLVMKTTKSRSDEGRKATADGIADKREVYMYSKVFPALRQMLMNSTSDYQLENIAKTFLTSEDYMHETTIMEDLRAKGYRLWNKEIPMNFTHIKTVMKNYGKYHAVSMALKAKSPQIFHDLAADMGNVFKYFENNENVRQLFIGGAKDALKIVGEFGLKEIVEKLKDMPENVPHILANTVEEDALVISHGDCWINNMMFRYQFPASMLPSGMCFLDFQIASLDSPAYDLSYFLYTACDEGLLSKKIQNFLMYYYDSFCDTLRDLKLEPEEIFTFHELKEHWRKYAIKGLIMASTTIKIQLRKKDEASVSNERDEDSVPTQISKIEVNDLYKNRIVGVYKHYAKTCLD